MTEVKELTESDVEDYIMDKIKKAKNVVLHETVPIKPAREFKGKLSGFRSNEERNFEKKHLKAYLKGETLFQFGRDHLGKPMYFKVKT